MPKHRSGSRHADVLITDNKQKSRICQACGPKSHRSEVNTLVKIRKVTFNYNFKFNSLVICIETTRRQQKGNRHKNQFQTNCASQHTLPYTFKWITFRCRYVFDATGPRELKPKELLATHRRERWIVRSSSKYFGNKLKKKERGRERVMR